MAAGQPAAGYLRGRPLPRRCAMPRHARLAGGGRPLAGLHGTSGGRAERVEGVRMRRTVKTEHHTLLGSRFLTHPPICEFRVEVGDADPL